MNVSHQNLLPHLAATQKMQKVKTEFQNMYKKQVELHKQQKRAKNVKISTPKTYTFMLDEKYSKVLDEWLSARKMKLSDYMKEIIELDMCED